MKGVLRGGNFRTMVEESRAYFPEGMGVCDLAENPSIRALLDAVVEKGVTPDSLLDSITSVPGVTAPNGELDPRLRSLVSEAMVGTDLPGRAPFTEGEFRTAVQRGLRDAWARFSQELEGRLRDAELKKDADLHARLAQEFLDVKRRMKEFASFYDEV